MQNTQNCDFPQSWKIKGNKDEDLVEQTNKNKTVAASSTVKTTEKVRKPPRKGVPPSPKGKESGPGGDSEGSSSSGTPAGYVATTAFGAVLSRWSRMPRTGWDLAWKIYCEKFEVEISQEDFTIEAKKL